MTSTTLLPIQSIQFSCSSHALYGWEHAMVACPQKVTFESKPNKVAPHFSNRLQHIIDILPSAVIILDMTGHVVESNSVAKDLLGEPLLGEAWIQIIQRAFAPKEHDGHEVSLRDGRLVRVDTRSLSPEPGQLITITDLTETRKLQAQLSHHQRLLSLGKMVASLAHQIRTPLSTSMLYASNLASAHLDEQKRVLFATKLQNSLSHLEHQVKDMLLFAKGGQVVATTFNMTHLVNRFQQAVSSTVEQNKAQLHIHNTVDESFQLVANQDALIGALTNLVNNSLQAQPSQCVMHLYAQLFADNQVQIQLIDNGPGIDNETLQHVLEPFYTTKSHGTGLGLAVVKSVVEAHNGRLAVTSLVGKGTAVTIRLPVKQPMISKLVNEQAA